MDNNPKFKPFLVRLRPNTRALLDAAAEDQRCSRASLIDRAVIEMLGDRYGQTTVGDRLDAMLGQK